MRLAAKVIMLLRKGGVGGGDPLAPAAPSLDLVTASDTGTSSTDNITSDTTPDLDLTTDVLAENDEIDIRDNGVVVDTHVVTLGEAGGTTITLGLAALAEGAHSLQARHRRDGHNSAWSSALAITVDTTAPTVQSISITSTPASGQTYGAGEAVQTTVTFTDSVIVTGTPQLTLNIGGVSKAANYASGSGTAALVFSYTIAAGDTDANGISIDANSLALNSGTIDDTAGNDATLTHSAVTDQSSHKVETTYTQHVVDFDGTNDWLTRDAALTGAADGKQLTISMWIEVDVDGSLMNFLFGASALAGATSRIVLRRQTTNVIQLFGFNSGGTQRLRADFGSLTVASGRNHIVLSVDLTDSAKRHVYVNGADAGPSWTTFFNDNINIACADWAVGAAADGSGKLNGQMADPMMFASYVDLSVQANRELFILAGEPVAPAAAIASLGTPLIAMTATTSAAWPTNNGSGGGFTEHGDVTDGSF